MWTKGSLRVEQYAGFDQRSHTYPCGPTITLARSGSLQLRKFEYCGNS